MGDLRAEIRRALLALEGSVSLQIEAVLRLTTRENVEDVVVALPLDFRVDLFDWIRTKCGEPPYISIGCVSQNDLETTAIGIAALREFWLS